MQDRHHHADGHAVDLQVRLGPRDTRIPRILSFGHAEISLVRTGRPTASAEGPQFTKCHGSVASLVSGTGRGVVDLRPGSLEIETGIPHAIKQPVDAVGSDDGARRSRFSVQASESTMARPRA